MQLLLILQTLTILFNPGEPVAEDQPSSTTINPLHSTSHPQRQTHPNPLQSPRRPQRLLHSVVQPLSPPNRLLHSVQNFRPNLSPPLPPFFRLPLRIPFRSTPCRAFNGRPPVFVLHQRNWYERHEELSDELGMPTITVLMSLHVDSMSSLSLLALRIF